MRVPRAEDEVPVYAVPSPPLGFAYMDVGKEREQDAVSFAYMDVGKGREQDAASFAYMDVGKGERRTR